MGVVRIHMLISVLPVLLLGLRLNAGASLDTDELTILHDSAGWEYITVSDPVNGMRIQHTCFDGQSHPEECSGTMTLNPDNTFVQKVDIGGKTVQRHGNYELDGREITFTDELKTKDGPYSLDINLNSKQMILQITQPARVVVRIQLMLEKEYKRQMQQRQERQQ